MNQENEMPGEDELEQVSEETGTQADDQGGDEVAALHAKIDEMKTTIAYAMAEADNARKRAERDVAEARLYGVQRFAGDLLSVADNFERALTAITPEMRAGMGDAGTHLLTGVEMTQKELIAALARHHVVAVASQPGDRFDPNLHQATAQIPSEHATGTIAAVLQPGWKIGDRVLRAAMVAVSSGEAPQSAPEASEAGEGEPSTEPGSRVDTKA